MTLLADGALPPRRRLDRDGQRLGHLAPADRRRGAAAARAGQIAIINADTDLTPYDTGTFASTGTVVAGQAVALTAAALRDNILDFASRHTGVDRADCRLEAEAVVCGNQRIALAELHAAGTADGHRFEAKRKAYLVAAHASPSTSRASAWRCIASPARSASCTACTPPISAG